LSVAILLAACGKPNRATLRGTFNGYGVTAVYLEQVTVGQRGRIDTTTTDARGRFRFTVPLADRQPAFYNLRAEGQGVIPLLLAPGEKVDVSSLADLAHNYQVEGSTGSAEIYTLSRMMLAGNRSLDSLATVYANLDPADPNADSLLRQYSRTYIRQKRNMIAFVVEHAASLSAVYALYQRMPGGEWYFSDEQDRLYFQMVADSLESRYPLSPHVLSLKQDVGQMQNRLALADMLNRAAEQTHPELELPDMFGTKVALSSLAGQVILIDFWTSDNAAARIRNAELAEVYAALHERGLEIYQVALDRNKLAWVTAVQQQRLPWISVSDLRGSESSAARLYSVHELPASVLIDRQGAIVGRDIPVEQLEARIRELL
jgi:peroxiredoxin